MADSSSRELDARTSAVDAALELEGWGARRAGGHVQVAFERNDNVRAATPPHSNHDPMAPATWRPSCR